MINKKALRLLALLLFISVFGIGCASKGLYEWGDYELALYRFYDDPENLDEYVEALDEIVNESESADRVPPGMYAEYAYVLYVSGQSDMATTYFQREKEKWPESALFMDMMIENVNSAPKPDLTQSGEQSDREVESSTANAEPKEVR